MSFSPHYLSYLLRLWPVELKGQTVWHASLTHISTSEEKGFADLPQLFAYLEKQTLPFEPPLPDEKTHNKGIL
jgi:hypothetical protein